MSDRSEDVAHGSRGSGTQARRRPQRLRRVLSGLIAVVCLFMIASAGDATAKSWGYDLAAELMSPYCPGRTLASCPSPQAAELVQWMVMQEAAGSTQEEVIAVLIERFGEEILGSPPAKGITLWAYIFPIKGFVVGGGFAVVALRRIVAGGAAPSAEAAPLAEAAPAEAPRTESTIEPNDDELARLVDTDLEARA